MSILGLHKDSVADLASLVSYHHEDDEDEPNSIVETIEDTEPKIFEKRIAGLEEEFGELYGGNSSSSHEDESDSSSDEFYDYSSDEMTELKSAASGLWHLLTPRPPKKNLIDCFSHCFPFNKKSDLENVKLLDRPMIVRDAKGAQQEDDCSVHSSEYGKQLTGSEYLAVVARLKLQETHPRSNARHKPQSIPGNNVVIEQRTKKKTILKNPTQTQHSSFNKKDSNSTKRRVLFPIASLQISRRSLNNKKVRFEDFVKVCIIPPLHAMSHELRSSIWWGKSDYEEFKKTARLIARTIMTFGSELWLNSSSSSSKDHELEVDFGAKWWCKFGHSRRGLEHLSNIREGRNRQQCVKRAFKAVMDEQRRQKVNMARNRERLAFLSREYTGWAQDLSYAAGLADQLAVKENFNLNVKNRDAFVLSNFISDPSEEKKEHFDGFVSVGDVIGLQIPTLFSPPKESISNDPQYLDAHTRSNLVLRKLSLKEESKRRLSSLLDKKAPEIRGNI